jgi:hypothetical protein
MRRTLLVAFCFVLLLTSAVLAGANPQVKLAIHVRAHNAKLACNYGTIIDCHDIVTTYAGQDVDAFPVFFDLNEWRGCEYAITWPIEWGSAAFTSCSDFVIGSITEPDSGASHTWGGDCGAGVMVPSYLWLYANSSGQICPKGHPHHGHIYALDCHEAVDSVPAISQGCAGLYGAAGADPCAIAVTPTTWGEIKSLFK